jgi:hypothetical protein
MRRCGRGRIRDAIVDVTDAEGYALACALEWRDSPEYQPLRPVRQANSCARTAFVEGAANPAG